MGQGQEVKTRTEPQVEIQVSAFLHIIIVPCIPIPFSFSFFLLFIQKKRKIFFLLRLFLICYFLVTKLSRYFKSIRMIEIDRFRNWFTNVRTNKSLGLGNCRKEGKYISSTGQKLTKKKLTVQTMCNVCILCCGRSPARGPWKRSKTRIQARKVPRRRRGPKVALARVEMKEDTVARCGTSLFVN